MEENSKWILIQVRLSILGNELQRSGDPRAELFPAGGAGWPGLRASSVGERS